MAGKKLNLELSMSAKGIDRATQQFAKFMLSIRRTRDAVDGLAKTQRKVFDKYYEALSRGKTTPDSSVNQIGAQARARVARLAKEQFLIDRMRGTIDNYMRKITNDQYNVRKAAFQTGGSSYRGLDYTDATKYNKVGAIAPSGAGLYSSSTFSRYGVQPKGSQYFPKVISSQQQAIQAAIHNAHAMTMKQFATSWVSNHSAASRAVNNLSVAQARAASVAAPQISRLQKAQFATGVLLSSLRTRINAGVKSLFSRAGYAIQTAAVRGWSKILGLDSRLFNTLAYNVRRAFFGKSMLPDNDKAAKAAAAESRRAWRRAGIVIRQAARATAYAIRKSAAIILAPFRLLSSAMNKIAKGLMVSGFGLFFGKQIMDSIATTLTGASFKELQTQAIGFTKRQIAAESMIGLEPTLNAFGALQAYSSSTGAEMEPMVDAFQEALKYSRDTPAILEFIQIVDRFARFTHRDLSTVFKSMLQLVSTGDVGRLSVTLGVPQSSLMNSKIEQAVDSQRFDKINEALNEIANNAGITREAFDKYVDSAVNQIDRFKVVSKNLMVSFFGYLTESLGNLFRPLNELLSSNAAQQFVSSLSLLISNVAETVTKTAQKSFDFAFNVDSAVNKVAGFMSNMATYLYPLQVGLDYALSLFTGGMSSVSDDLDFSNAHIEAMRIRNEEMSKKVITVVDRIASLIDFALDLPNTIKDVFTFILTTVRGMEYLLAGVAKSIRIAVVGIMQLVNKVAGKSLHEYANANTPIYKVASIEGAVPTKGLDTSKPLITGGIGQREQDIRRYIDKAIGVQGSPTLEQNMLGNSIMAVYFKQKGILDPMAYSAEQDGAKYAVFEKTISEVVDSLTKVASTDKEVLRDLSRVDTGNIRNYFDRVSQSLVSEPTNKDRLRQNAIAGGAEGFTNFMYGMQQKWFEHTLRSSMSEAIMSAVSTVSGGQYKSFDELRTDTKEMYALALKSSELFQTVLKPQIIQSWIAKGIDASQATTLFDKLSKMVTDKEKYFGFRPISENRPIPVKPVGAVSIAKEDLVMLAELAQREYVSNFNAQIYAPAPVNTYNVQSNANSLEALAKEMAGLNKSTPQSNINNYGAMSRKPGAVYVGG